MYLLLLFLPLISSLTAGMFGWFIGSTGAAILTVLCLLITFSLSLLIFFEVGLAGSTTYLKLMPWINSELFNTDWGFLFDSLTVIMCCVVTFIFCLVHLFSTEYMSHVPHLPRFMS